MALRSSGVVMLLNENGNDDREVAGGIAENGSVEIDFDGLWPWEATEGREDGMV